MSYIAYLIVSILALILIVKIFAWPFKVLIKLLINGFLGYILLFLMNSLGKGLGIYIPINNLSCLIAGFFGIPGVIFLIIVNKFF